MNVTQLAVTEGLVMCSELQNYGKEPSDATCQAWFWIMEADQVTEIEFKGAIKRHLKTFEDFPSPAAIITLVKTQRQIANTLPALPEIPSLPPPGPRYDGSGRKTHSSRGELLVTPEFHQARCKLMLERFDAMDAASGKPLTRLQNELRATLESIISRPSKASCADSETQEQFR